MTNAEKYKDEIIAQLCETGDCAVDKNTGAIMGCHTNSCSKCLFSKGYFNAKVRWLNSEYKERKEFTDDERALIKLLDRINWIVRDDYDNLWGCLSKPRKFDVWQCEDMYLLENVTSLPFAAIKSTDTEPTSRAEILGEKE